MLQIQWNLCISGWDKAISGHASPASYRAPLPATGAAGAPIYRGDLARRPGPNGRQILSHASAVEFDVTWKSFQPSLRQGVSVREPTRERVCLFRLCRLVAPPDSARLQGRSAAIDRQEKEHATFPFGTAPACAANGPHRRGTSAVILGAAASLPRAQGARQPPHQPVARSAGCCTRKAGAGTWNLARHPPAFRFDRAPPGPSECCLMQKAKAWRGGPVRMSCHTEGTGLVGGPVRMSCRAESVGFISRLGSAWPPRMRHMGFSAPPKHNFVSY